MICRRLRVPSGVSVLNTSGFTVITVPTLWYEVSILFVSVPPPKMGPGDPVR